MEVSGEEADGRVRNELRGVSDEELDAFTSF